MDNISIEPLSKDRLEDTIEAVVSIFGENLRSDAEKDFSLSFSDYPHPHVSLIAILDDTIIGMVQCQSLLLAENTYAIAWVGVSQKYRNKNIGSSLTAAAIHYIENNLLKEKSGSIVLVSDINPSFYEQFGFVCGPSIHTTHPIMLKNIKGK